MKVLLKRNWYAPDGRRYRRDPNGGTTEIPDELKKQLPKDAEVLSEAEAKKADAKASGKKPTVSVDGKEA